MQFYDLDISDIDSIYDIINKTGYQSCQLSVASLYCYADKYNTQICIKDGFLYIKQNRQEALCYFMPIGLGDLNSAIKELINYNNNIGGNELLFWGIADDMVSNFKNAVNPIINEGQIELIADRDWAEYIHSAENLLNLKGKQFHAKKNAVNQFLRNNSDFSYESVDETNLDELLDFQSRLLCGVKKFEKDEQRIKDLISENTAILRGINNFQKLGLIGGVIRIDGDICAYAVGGAISPTTFDMTFEKALRNYNGIFQVLEQKMIVTDLSAFSHINREEDLGIEGLRFSKLKLRPDKLLMKYTARI